MAEIPNDPSKFSYRGDTKVTITGQEFIILQHMAQKAMANGVDEKFILQKEWVDRETGDLVEKPTKKQLTEGKVIEVPSKKKTLSSRQVSYNSNLFPEIFDGNDVIFNIHLRNVESDIAVPIEVIQKENQERREAEAKKGSMTVVEEK